MLKYQLTKEAESDIQSVIRYTLEEWDKEQAHHYINNLEEQFDFLCAHPKLGKERNTLVEGLRSFPYANHMTYYVIDKQKITIVRILHQSMDAGHHLKI